MTLFIGNRLYPQDYEYHPEEPDSDSFCVLVTDSLGWGLISNKLIKPDNLVFRFSGESLNYQTLYTLQKSIGHYIEDKYVMGRVLHSCSPNCIVDVEKQTFTSIKTINIGDYITMDYNSTEYELFRSFECKCGAINCNKLIKGYKYDNKR